LSFLLEMANDDDYIEDFNITESDLDSALNPTRRRHGRQTREEAIYGMCLCLTIISISK